MVNEIVCYTDGSAVVSGVNKGKGGCGIYFPNFNGKPRGVSVGFEKTKTGRTEIYGLLTAIRQIKDKKPIRLTVYSDSQYVVKAFTDGRLEKWRNNGWQNTTGNVKNRDLWERLLDELKEKDFLTLDMRWIKSHQLEKEKDLERRKLLKQDEHVIGNAMADKLAERWRVMKKLNKDL